MSRVATPRRLNAPTARSRSPARSNRPRASVIARERTRTSRSVSASAFSRRIGPLALDLAPFVASAVVALAPDGAVVARAVSAAVLTLSAACAVVARATPSAALARLTLALGGGRSRTRGRVVWVTGATQGLGEAIAMRYAELGAIVIASGRGVERCEATARACERAGAASAHAVPFDMMGSREDVDAAVRRAFAIEGRVDVFVHCAGGSQAASALGGDDEEVDRALFQLNALGAIAITKGVAKAMLRVREQRSGDAGEAAYSPTIVGVCSVASKLPAPGQAVYAAAKSAYAAFLNSLRSEIADTGVRVVCAYPGPIATGMNGQERVIFRKDMASSTPSPGVEKKTQSRTPVASSKGRMPVQDVARDIVAAACAGHDELVLAPQPIMALTYIIRFVPALAYAALDVVGPKRARKADAGENMYDLSEK